MKNQNIKFISEIMKTNWKYFWYCVIAMVVNVGLSFVTPKIVGVTVDSVLREQPFDLPDFLVKFIEDIGGRDFLLDHLYLCGALVLGLTLFTAVSFFLRSYNGARLADFLSYKMRRMLFNHIQRLPFSWHKSIQTGDIMQRCSSDVDTICRFVSMQFIDVIRIVFMLIIAYILMFSLNTTLAWVCLAFVPIIIFYSGVFFKRIARNFKIADEAEGRLHAVAQENFTGVRVVRAFGMERQELDKFKDANKTYADHWIKTGKLLSLYWSLGDLISGLQMGTLIVLGTVLTVRGQMTPGEIMIFAMYGSMLSWPMRRLGRTLGEMSKASVSIERINEIMHVKAEKEPEEDLFPDIKGHIRFENVSFDFDGAEVLKNVSFELPAGRTLAILGGTGSGKSTLLHLINRMYDLGEGQGTIYVDDIDIRLINARHLRRCISMVLQEPFLFSDTISNNLTLAAKGIEYEKLTLSTKDAAIHDSILEFPQGYDTIIGEKGVTLSGGQRQRVAIARALACDSPVLVFDDSLSAVDVQTDSRIRASIKRRSSDITTIIVSHRVSTLMDADMIMVLSDGTVRELGTHDELMALGGVYKSIYDIQSFVEEEIEAETLEGNGDKFE